MTYGNLEKPKLFNDEQMRQYVADGYVLFQPDVPDEVHKTVMEKLQYMCEEEYNYGNNVLPRVTEMDRILNSPEVRGALISVLGPGYIEHPHRFCHYIAPGAKQKDTMEEGLHQDSYTPLGRPRQHYPRFARVMYYPQHSPVEIGPTHAIPGTQYHKQLTAEDRKNAIPLAGKTGMVSITHFDIGHGAGINKVNQPRHMIKFVYTRAEEPSEPSWDCQDRMWSNPKNFETPHNLNLVWSHIWDWLCGKKDRYESFRASNKADAMNGVLDALSANDLGTRISAMHLIAACGNSDAIPTLISRLNSDPQWERLTAVYTLGALGQSAVDPLVAMLKKSANDEDPMTEIWNEGSISMNDASHALAAIGAPSLKSLIGLLDNSNEWVRINAAFALGEMDSDAAEAVPTLTRCLDDASHCVVRTATDALSTIKQKSEEFIPSLGRLLKKGRPEWLKPDRRKWTHYDQVRVNAAMAFTRLGKDAMSAEELLLDKLADPNGHVSAFAAEALRRIGTPLAIEGLMEYLMTRRWDDSLMKDRTF
jgi:HEAT repeat protein